MNQPLISLKTVTIGYGSQPVLAGISFDILHGSFSAILGPNGSGKSTLLKTILGLQSPITGKISFDPSNQPIFGYVPQSTQFDSLYLLTGFDVALMGVYGRIGPGKFVTAQERDFVRECLEATSATEFSQKNFSELSGGQKQRILIARALATKPNILVLDEPTAGVDTATTKVLLEFISQIHKERNLTILLVTHDLPLVRKHAQQVIWLHHGDILNGSADELLAPDRMAQLLEIEIS